jgi:ribosomal protein L33
MAKKAKGNRQQVILECTEHKESGQPGTSRYITTKNRKKGDGGEQRFTLQEKDKEKILSQSIREKILPA